MAQRETVKIVTALIIGILIGFSGGWYWQQQTIVEQKRIIEGFEAAKPLVVENGEIRVLATVNGKYFDTPTRHGVVYEWGKNGEKSIFKAKATPKEFYNALISLGATPGNNVKIDSPKGTKVEGTIVDVYVTWEGAGKRYSLEEVVENYSAVIKFGGNLDRSNEYLTGCILCLDSCAVGITSNSMVGWKSGMTWVGNEDVLPPDGTLVYVIFVPQV
ncbi:MAG: YdjY domain-containing protein [Candidatus Bathyarchaeia archaeon]